MYHKETFINTYRILTLIRANISNSANVLILETLTEYFLGTPANGELNEIFSKRLANLKDLTSDYREFFSNSLVRGKTDLGEISPRADVYIPIILKALDEVLYCLQNQLVERAYDLVDALQAIPDAVLIKNWDERRLWKTYIHPYRRKWNATFLVQEETNL